MNTAVKQEFYRLIESIDPAELNEIDCKLLNLLIAHFDTILPLGTAGGSRAKKIGELIQKNHIALPGTFPNFESSKTSGADKATTVGSLKIGPFRGFARSESFVFDKKYTFMYGPNGSGKSSFCEGLEYALLGGIEEASAKRISVDQYIKNAQKRCGVEPEAFAPDGKTRIEKNLAYYRFAFIEKNRIDGFARIAATTSSVQRDRIATLFGLDAFSNYVDGFTDEIDGRYLPLQNTLREAFSTELQKNDRDKDKIEANNAKLNKLNEDIRNLIKESGQEGIKTLEELTVYLNGSDGISGYLAELRKDETQQIPDDMKFDKIDSIEAAISKVSTEVNELKAKLFELAKLSTNVNFKELYSAIENIGKSGGREVKICPACQTPIANTTVDPFVYAAKELQNLKSLSALQESVKALGKSLATDVRNTATLTKSINVSCEQTGYTGKQIPFFTEFVFTEIQMINSWLPQLESEITLAQSCSEIIQSIRNHFVKFNEEIAARRTSHNTLAEKIKMASGIHTRCIEIATSIKTIKEENTTLQKSIDDFGSANATKLQAIADEEKKISIYQQFADSYTKLIGDIKRTRNLLPSKYSSGLSIKVKEYYNNINAHDPDFEKIDSLSLPVMSNSKIEIQFVGDSAKYDALHVLSEGHIKVLGLSILLAKAKSENLGFLIFDDIVNAIDDDHRDGVAELLMRHEDMKNRQIIVTCHGDTFINKLEHKLGASDAGKHVKNFQFVPIDTAQERGVQVSIGNSKHYILKAKEDLKNNSLKEAATECRRAVESVSTQLWKKLDRILKVNLKVTMRSPGFPPDLFTVVDSLLGELSKINGTNDLKTQITELKTKYSWSLLNKGVHEDEKQPEFERTDIQNLIELIEKIEALVESIKLQISAI